MHWRVMVPPTLDGPLEEGLAGLTGGHAVVVSRGNVAANQAQPLGHSPQHELTLHGAFIFHIPSPYRHKGEEFCNFYFGGYLILWLGETNRLVCSDAAGQPSRVAVGARRVQAIAVAFDQGPEAGVRV